MRGHRGASATAAQNQQGVSSPLSCEVIEELSWRINHVDNGSKCSTIINVRSARKFCGAGTRIVFGIPLPNNTDSLLHQGENKLIFANKYCGVEYPSKIHWLGMVASSSLKGTLLSLGEVLITLIEASA
ncbi:hypothetical protein HPP92_012396 [Vanilla planifolia]|uniref:Uncharacterized protein n=1 Tax=Vanilla planifolia TaxID=51239 RepID=A0A835QZU8_VANPL|nr:hypothetical protein HPP92_012396 [Vanilla planifolia]